MKRTYILSLLTALSMTFCPELSYATRLLKLSIIDKDYLMLHFRDGEVRYRDDGTGPSAYLGHTFVEGDDTLKVFGKRLDVEVAAQPDCWFIRSEDDASYGKQQASGAHRKSKPMNTDNTLSSELDHWIFLRLPQPMKQGCTYIVEIPSSLNSDSLSAQVKFDIWNSQSEAVHVNILGYVPQEPVKPADLY